jgi:hypothetical protein
MKKRPRKTDDTQEFRVVYRMPGDVRRFERRKSRSFAEAFMERARELGAEVCWLERRKVGKWARV